MVSTSETLLGELRGQDQPAAWAKFVQLYTPLLYGWLRRTGLQEADAADLVQEVFRVLVVKLSEFEYDRDKSFRNWLHGIALNLWRNHCRQSVRHANLLNNLPERPPADDAFHESRYQQFLLTNAMELVRPEFQESTWQAFVLHGVDQRPAAEVAKELGLSVGAVYSCRCRVVARLRNYLQGLLD